MNSQDMNPQDMNPQDIDMQDIDTQDIDSQDMNLEFMSQKQIHQQRSIIHHWNMNEREDSDYEYSSDEEDPTPKWSIPNWKGNATAVTTINTTTTPVVNKCTGCVMRISNEGEERGCEECDEYWDMPDLATGEEIDAGLTNFTGRCTGCITRVSYDGENRGCEECDEHWELPDLLTM